MWDEDDDEDFEEDFEEEDEDLGPSKTQIKKEMLALQDLGLELLTLPLDRFADLEMDERLREGLEDLRRIKAHSARKRQMKYVGKLLRSEDVEPFREALAQLRQGAASDAALQHAAEQWRDRLLTDDSALQEWLNSHPSTPAKAFRGLVKSARQEFEAAEAAAARGGPAKRGRHYRELFRTLRDLLSA